MELKTLGIDKLIYLADSVIERLEPELVKLDMLEDSEELNQKRKELIRDIEKLTNIHLKLSKLRKNDGDMYDLTQIAVEDLILLENYIKKYNANE